MSLKPTPKDWETYDPAIHWNPDADIDWDGIVSYHDYIVWRLLNYNHTLTPTYYKDKDWKTIRIADVPEKPTVLETNW